MTPRELPRRRTLLAVTAGLLLIAGPTGCGGDPNGPAARKAPPISTTQPPSDDLRTAEGSSSPPTVGDWLLELGTDGSAVYVVTRSCPGTLRDGHCETVGGHDGSHFVSGHQQSASTVSLWRYQGGTWRELGEVPGVSTPARRAGHEPGRSWLRPHPLERSSELMRVGAGAIALPGSSFGELVVSGDDGETWEPWRLPWRPSQCRNGYVPCDVVVSEEHVVAAATTLLRRKVGSDEWEDVTPPERAPYNIGDDGRYGLLALDDGTIIATADDIWGATGSYRVSTDSGSTWSDPRPNPGVHSQFDAVGGVHGSAVYATCWTRFGTGSGSQCGFYRSTDLVHWTKVPSDQGPSDACRRQGAAEYESVVKVGGLTYAIAHVPHLDGHPATRQDDLDASHDVRHVLEVSADGCRTWQSLLE